MGATDGTDDPTLTPEQAGSLDTAPDSTPKATPSRDTAATGYELRGLLGTGGMGEVLIAHDRDLEREVALKRIKTDDPSAIERFLREAKIQARLDHPAIVPIHELGRDADGRPFFTMKRISGVTLAALLQAPEPPRQRMLRAFVDVCLAVELAHSRRVVHRDLKPANIMLGDYGEVYVLDWGIARILVAPTTIRGEDLPGSAATQAGTIIGTLGYMPPEQARGEVAGPKADVYALGAILFEILAGEPLHPRGQAALASTLEAPRQSPGRRRPDRGIPPELDDACSAALAKGPATRPTARELGERVQRYLDGDRDLERRRELAAAQLSSARTAFASGGADARASAIRRAARAVILDPDSAEAAELLSSLMVDPPKEYPPDLVKRLDDMERANTRTRSRRGAVSQLLVFAFVLVTPVLSIRDWTWFGALCAMSAGIAARTWWLGRTGRANPYFMLAFYFVFAIIWTRFASPFVLLPALMCGALLGMAQSSWLQDRPWIVPMWILTALMTPIGLEWAGILERTWAVEGSLLTVRSIIIDARGALAEVTLIVGTIAFVTMTAMFALMISRTARDAQRKLEIQAWQLEQLVPSRTVRATTL